MILPAFVRGVHCPLFSCTLDMPLCRKKVVIELLYKNKGSSREMRSLHDYEGYSATVIELLRRDPINTLLDFANQTLHAIPNTVRLNADTFSACPIYTRARAPPEADVDATKLQVQRWHGGGRFWWRVEHR